MIGERVLAKRSRGRLRSYFEHNDGHLIHKWVHFFDIYERHFHQFRGTRPTVLEIGVSHGGSLQMWRHYFGRGSTIIGIDINERARSLEEPGIHIVVGDQSDPVLLRSVVDRHGPFDIVIDDGSHIAEHQLLSIGVLWPHVKVGGVYVVEDLHTSYWPQYGGGLGVEGSFMEWIKTRVDDLNAFHSREATFQPTEWTRSIGGLHLYDSVAVLDKADVSPQVAGRRTGFLAFGTTEGPDAEFSMTDDHRAQLASLGSPRARVRRLVRHPVATTRRVVTRWLQSRR